MPLLAAIDSAIGSRNLTYAVRITGRFTPVRTRTAAAQAKPYPPLVEATATQAVAEFTDVPGTVAGFRTPDYEQGISVAGYHLHFIDDDRTQGGHCLEAELDHGVIELSDSSELHLSLPRTSDFLAANLMRRDSDREIRRAEGRRPAGASSARTSHGSARHRARRRWFQATGRSEHV